MKKNFLRMATLASAVAVLAFASCKKENRADENLFTATIEQQQSKTTIGFDEDGGYMQWEAGDKVAIYGTNEETGDPTGPISFTATPDNEDMSQAVLARTRGGNDPVPEGENRYAIYPYSIAQNHTDYGIVTLPATQTYSGSRLEAPMWAAATSENELAFKNLCGVLKITQEGDYTISSIVVTSVGSADYVCGDFSIALPLSDLGGDEDAPQLVYSANGSHTVTLNCGGASSTGNTFYLYLPAQEYAAGLTITVNLTNGGNSVRTLNQAFTVERNHYYSINFRPIGVKGGRFSIGNGKQIYFAQGNLQYQPSTGTWRFAEHQYDFVGGSTYGNVYENGVKCDNSLIAADYTGWIDLFSWGTGDDPLRNSNTATYDWNEWGDNPILNGGNEGGKWRTLTQKEWAYLLSHSSSTTGSRPNGNKTAKGRIVLGNNQYVYGWILIPDNWTTEDMQRYNFTSSATNISTANNYTPEQWAIVEAAGAVFLPQTLSRNVTTLDTYNWTYGNYWSSSSSNPNGSYSAAYAAVGTGAANLSVEEGRSRYVGYGVRLVLVEE